MKVYFAPKFGNMYMAAIDDDGLWGLWGCRVKDKETARDALLKRLIGKSVLDVDRKPFFETDEVMVFSGKAEWDWRENVAVYENMLNGFINNCCII